MLHMKNVFLNLMKYNLKQITGVSNKPDLLLPKQTIMKDTAGV